MLRLIELDRRRVGEAEIGREHGARTELEAAVLAGEELIRLELLRPGPALRQHNEGQTVYARHAAGFESRESRARIKRSHVTTAAVEHRVRLAGVTRQP